MHSNGPLPPSMIYWQDTQLNFALEMKTISLWTIFEIIEQNFYSLIYLLTLITLINNKSCPTLTNSLFPSERLSPLKLTVNVVLDAITMILVQTNEIIVVTRPSKPCRCGRDCKHQQWIEQQWFAWLERDQPLTNGLAVYNQETYREFHRLLFTTLLAYGKTLDNLGIINITIWKQKLDPTEFKKLKRDCQEFTEQA